MRDEAVPLILGHFITVGQCTFLGTIQDEPEPEPNQNL
jgi:hypothetical protein